MFTCMMYMQHAYLHVHVACIYTYTYSIVECVGVVSSLPLNLTTELKSSLSYLPLPCPARASMVRGGWVVRVLRQERRLMAR